MLDEGFAAGLRHFCIESRVILYAEREAYPCAVLESRMDEGSIHAAPIWCGDFTALDGKLFRGLVDAIVAGFPCQDLSVAGKRAGLDGKRSGLFFEIVKFADDCEARFMFLENVAGIASATASVMDETEELEERAASRVLGELADRGWNAEWLTLSASDVGASHGRARWFCFAWRQKLDDTKGRNLRNDVHDERTSSGKIDCSSDTGGMLGNSEHTGFDASKIGNGTQSGNDGFQTGAVNACEPSGSGVEYGQVGNSGLQHIDVQQRTVRNEHQGTGEELADSECTRRQTASTGYSFDAKRQPEQGCVLVADTSKPGSQGNEFGKPCDSNWGGGRKHMDQLPNFVAFSPLVHQTSDGQKSSENTRNGRLHLNPLFASWLMGWPLQWTIAEPHASSALETELWRCKLDAQLRCLLNDQKF